MFLDLVFSLDQKIFSKSTNIILLNSGYDEGEIECNTRLSPRLYKMVQKANNVDELEDMIKKDKKASEQCRKTLLKRSDELYEFKDKRKSFNQTSL